MKTSLRFINTIKRFTPPVRRPVILGRNQFRKKVQPFRQYNQATHNMPLTPEQTQLIKSTVPVLREYGTQVTKVCSLRLSRRIQKLNLPIRSSTTTCSETTQS